MWILITKNCVTPFGPLYEGQTCDYNAVTIKEIPKGCYKKCPAPWEQAQLDQANKDKAAADAAAKAADETEQIGAVLGLAATADRAAAKAEQSEKTNGPEKQEKQKPERKPPKKH